VRSAAWFSNASTPIARATAAVILILAVPAGHFFAQARLTNILIALALGTLLDGFANIGIVDFRRELTFGKEFQLWLLPRLIGIILTLAVAFTWRNQDTARHHYPRG
jgi:hypothetical protein